MDKKIELSKPICEKCKLMIDSGKYVVVDGKKICYICDEDYYGRKSDREEYKK